MHNSLSCYNCNTLATPASEIALALSSSSNKDFLPAYIVYRSWFPSDPCQTSSSAERSRNTKRGTLHTDTIRAQFGSGTVDGGDWRRRKALRRANGVVIF